MYALGNGDVLHRPFVRAGNWVFGTGLRAVTSAGLVDPRVLRAGRPLDPPPQAEREADFVFQRIASGLADAGSALANVVRVDQYYTDPAAVDPYHVARRRAMAGKVAPSTSIIVSRLLNTNASLDVQMLAFIQESGYSIERFAPQAVDVPATSGYAPCVRAGDLVFVAGQLARDASGGIAADATVPDGQLWNGTRIRRETDYLIGRRLVPALAAAGSALDLVVKAQVYLSRPDDFPQFWQSWAEAFGARIPPTTVVPVRAPAFGTRDATIEINLIAAHASARERLRDIRLDVPLPCAGMLAACVIDGLVLLPGLMAIDGDGLVPRARVEPSAPWFHDSARAQMEDILDKADHILRAAGSDLTRVVRGLQFHADLANVHGAHLAWRGAVGGSTGGTGVGLPFAAIEVAPGMFVPGVRLICDFWGSVA